MKFSILRFLTVGLAALLCLLGTGIRAQAEWLSGWAYRAPIVVNHAGDLLTDHTVRLDLNDTHPALAHALANGADLRVTASDGLSLLPFWIETWNAVSGIGVIWIKLPEIPAGTTQVYAYYGNPEAGPAGNGPETFLFYDSFETETAGLNAPAPLITPSYDGTGQQVHPDVVFVPGGWGSPGSYPYWMAVTPYPWGNDDYENPSVLVSTDGIQWDVPPGLTNPLAPNPADGHHCDPDMVLFDNQMFFYYMLGGTSTGTSHLRLFRSSDGVHWTGPETVLTAPDFLVSPTFVEVGGELVCWYIDSPGCSANYSTVRQRVSPDGLHWGTAATVEMALPGYVIWHMDIRPTPGGYAVLAAAYPSAAGCGQTSLFFGESADGLHWNLDPRPLLEANPMGWDNAQIYRSTFVVNGDDLRIWYSACKNDGAWRVGYTEGGLEDFWRPDSPWDSGRGQMAITGEHARTGEKGLVMTGGSAPQLLKDLNGLFAAHAWIYDDLAVTPGLMSLLRVWDPGTPEYPLHAIGVGIWQGSSETHYTTHTEGWNYTVTGVPRSSGWHKLTIRASADRCDLFLDDAWVRSLEILDEGNLTGISLDSFLGGTSWYDDVYAHPVTDSEPGVSAGEEEVLGWGPAYADTGLSGKCAPDHSGAANCAFLLVPPALVVLFSRKWIKSC